MSRLLNSHPFWVVTLCVIALSSKLSGQDFVKLDLGQNDTPDLANSTALAEDIDADGDIDIVIHGSIDGRYQAYLLLNQGKGTFKTSQPFLKDITDISMDLGDVNGDNHLDLLVSGNSPAGPVTNLYTYNKYNSKFQISDVDLPGISNGASLLEDINLDGATDIFLADKNTSLTLFYDTTNGSYSQQGLGFEKLENTEALWFDLGRDGDLDLVLFGTSDGSSPSAYLYRQEGDGTFTVQELNDQFDYEKANLRLIDFDGDLDLDLCTLGNHGDPASIDVYIQEDDQTFTLSNYKLPRYPAVAFDVGPLTTDGEINFIISLYTGSSTFTSALRVSAETGSLEYTHVSSFPTVTDGEILLRDFYNDGTPEILLSGGEEKSFTGIYKKSPFNGRYEDLLWSFKDISSLGSMDLADFDNDGDLDLIASGGEGRERFGIFKWESGAFVPYYTGVTGAFRGTIKWVDYDSDGLMDFHLVGYRAYLGRSNVLYQQQQDGSFVLVDKGFSSQVNVSSDWADYDKDGDMDLLSAGSYFDIPADFDGIGSPAEATRVYQQQANGNFTIRNLAFKPIHVGSAQWIDYNQDGFLDMFITGTRSDQSGVTELYKQQANHSFTRQNTNFPVESSLKASWGDYQRDGDLDLVILKPHNEQPGSGIIIHIQESDGTFQEFETSIPQFNSHGDLWWFDYNNDGWDDILVASKSEGNKYTEIYEQKPDGTFEPTGNNMFPSSNSHLVLGDIDNDTDIDVLAHYINAVGKLELSVYRNELIPTPLPPEMSIDSETIDFGVVEIGDTYTKSLTITNTGEQSLEITRVNVPSPFNLNWEEGTITRGESQVIEITFAPNTEGSFFDTLRVYSNAGEEAIGITGVGEVLVTSTEPDLFKSLAIFPNPAEQNLNISGLPPDTKSIVLLSSQGQVFLEVRHPETNISLKLNSLNNGIYLLKVSGKAGSTVKKIIIRR